MERRIEKMNWKQFAKTVPQKIDIVLLPVGTIETHGPGALGTDVIIPAYLAERISQKVNALVAPSINYGVTSSLIAYPGSLTVGSETLKAYVRDVAFSLADAGFKKVIILNGHGGNIGSLDSIGKDLWTVKKTACIVIDWWMAAEEIALKYFDGTGHAGADELAALMAIDPGMIAKADYQKDDAGHRFKGINMHPFYRSIILNQPGKGYPAFDLKRSKKFMEDVVTKLSMDIKKILSGWEKVI
jgi:creatinine amidohydrolase